MKFSEDLRPILQRLLDGCKDANPNMNASDAVDAMEAQTVLHVQAAMRELGTELTYGEAFDLWGLVNLDSQTSWVEADSADGAVIEMTRLCQHVRDGCDYASISRPID